MSHDALWWERCVVAGTRTELDRARVRQQVLLTAHDLVWRSRMNRKPWCTHTNEWAFPFFFGQLNHVSARWLDVGLEKLGGRCFKRVQPSWQHQHWVYRMLRLTDSRFFELAPFRSIGFPPPTDNKSLLSSYGWSISVCVYCVLPNTTSSIKSGKRAKKHLPQLIVTANQADQFPFRGSTLRLGSSVTLVVASSAVLATISHHLVDGLTRSERARRSQPSWWSHPTTRSLLVGTVFVWTHDHHTTSFCYWLTKIRLHTSVVLLVCNIYFSIFIHFARRFIYASGFWTSTRAIIVI